MCKILSLFLALHVCLAGLATPQKDSVEMLVVNATIYTVDSQFQKVEGMAIDKGKIVATGTTDKIKSLYVSSKTIDAKNKFIYPGFIDAHCHFYAYGKSLNECDLRGTDSWEAVLNRLKAFAAKHPGGWLIGRGWDQNDWKTKSFPTNDELNKLFPDRPVYLTRVDGHAAIANVEALKQAGILPTAKIDGGEIILENSKLTGVLIDNATSLVNRHIPATKPSEAKTYLKDAQRNCFAAGLTGVHECGVDAALVEIITDMQQEQVLQMRMYIMLSDNAANYKWAFKNGKIKTEKLTVTAFKLYADGALGSRGACLLEPYNDKPGWFGFLLKPLSYFDSILPVIADNGWQACTHAIGDSANRAILKLYGKYASRQTDSRWRIEHAQVIDAQDFDWFGKYHVIPSVQPTHATSDMYWAAERLGDDRLRSAYAYKTLLNQNGWMPLGTDFPVEEIYPIKTFYAAVFRQDDKGYPQAGFQIANALSREEALRGMTISAAKAAFEENEKGTIEVGKYADFVMLDRDLMTAPADKVLSTTILMTVIDGKIVYKQQ